MAVPTTLTLGTVDPAKVYGLRLDEFAIDVEPTTLTIARANPAAVPRLSLWFDFGIDSGFTGGGGPPTESYMAVEGGFVDLDAGSDLPVEGGEVPNSGSTIPVEGGSVPITEI